jgi:hypothetical protein
MLALFGVKGKFSRCLGFRLLQDHVFGHWQYLGLIEVAEMVYFIYYLVCGPILFGFVVSFVLVIILFQVCCSPFFFLLLFLVYSPISGLLLRVAENFNFFYTIYCG